MLRPGNRLDRRFVGVRKSFGVKTDDRASTSPQV